MLTTFVSVIVPSQCSFADCVNYKKSQEPFYLHPPSTVTGHPQPQHGGGGGGVGRGKVAVKDGLYVVSSATSVPHLGLHPGKEPSPIIEPVAPQQQHQQPKGPFYLHNPNGIVDDPVKDIFVKTDKTCNVATKANAYASSVAPPAPPMPAIGLNTMTGKTDFYRAIL